MNRRAQLTLLLVASLAGCTSGASTSTHGATPTVTSTATPTPEPTRPSAQSLQTVTLQDGDAPMNAIFAFGSLWVPAHHGGVLVRVNPTTGKTIARIPAGVGPGSVVASKDALWLIDYRRPHLIQIDPTRNAVRRSITLLGESCCHAAVAGDTVWVASGDPGTGQLEGFNTQTGKRVKRVPGLWNPAFLLGRLWATDSKRELVLVDARTAKVTAPPALMLAPNSTSHGLFWAPGDGVVVGIDRTGAVKIEAKRDDGQQVIYGEAQVAASESSVWVASATGELLRVDPVTGAARLVATVPGGISSLVVLPGKVWVSNFDRNELLSFAG